MLRFQRKVIAVKTEAGGYGVDPVPTAAANALVARDVELNPLETETEQRIADVGYAGNLGEILAGQYVTLNYKVELAGAGAAGSVPQYGPILKAAGCSETINAGVSVVYAPVHPAAAVSMAQYIWLDGTQHKITGCLADASIMMPKGRTPYLQISTLGLFNAPVDAAVPAPTFTAITPVAVNKVNTTPMTLHGFAGVFSDFQMKLGNDLKYRNLPNSEAVRLLDRNSTGSCRLEAELIGTKDWYTIIKNASLGAFQVIHGQVAGNKVQIDAANVQLLRPKLPVEDKLIHKALDLLFRPSSAGNDEWALTIK